VQNSKVISLTFGISPALSIFLLYNNTNGHLVAISKSKSIVQKVNSFTLAILNYIVQTEQSMKSHFESQQTLMVLQVSNNYKCTLTMPLRKKKKLIVFSLHSLWKVSSFNIQYGCGYIGKTKNLLNEIKKNFIIMILSFFFSFSCEPIYFYGRGAFQCILNNNMLLFSYLDALRF
jgi:hypothetical protein